MIDPAAEWLDVLSSDGRTVVGTAPRSKVHACGLPHRATHVLVFAHDGRLLLQRRAATKGTFPGFWDTSVGGHVDAGETVLQAAVRETFEELGIVVDSELLTELPGHFVDLPLDREWVGNFQLVHEGPFRPDPIEVEHVAWFDASRIEEIVASGATTPHFAIQWRLWLRDRMSGSR